MTFQFIPSECCFGPHTILGSLLTSVLQMMKASVYYMKSIPLFRASELSPHGASVVWSQDLDGSVK
jgi:hypothetical protein